MPLHYSELPAEAAPSTMFCQNLATTVPTSLVYGYKGGICSLASVPTTVADGTLTLTASTTCYVFINALGAVTFNTTGFPAPCYHMAQVVTTTNTLTVTNKRSGAPAIASSGNPITRNAIQSALMDATNNDKGAFLASALDALPTMTSDTAPAGWTASASSVATAGTEWHTFDNTTANAMAWAATTVFPCWVQMQATTGFAATQYKLISSSAGALNTAPTAWTFLGSNDGTTWVTLDTQTGQTALTAANSASAIYSFANTTAYTYYRLNITTDGGNAQCMLGEMRIYSGGSSSTAIDHKATAAPTAFSFANGLNADGTFNNINAQLTTDQAGFYSGSTASATNYLFAKLASGVLSGIVGPYAQTVHTVALSALSVGTIATWHMDEASGTNVADSVGTYAGTVTGTTIVAGKYGNARSFNGSSDIITVAGNPIPLNGDFTICMWVNVTALPTSYTSLIGCGSGWSFRFHNNGGARIGLNRFVASTNYYVEANSTFSTGAWEHVAVTYTASTGSVSFFYNGTLSFTTSVTTGSISGSATNATMGYNSSMDTEYFHGDMDEIYIFNQALTAAQITNISNNLPANNTQANTSYYDPIQNKCFIYNGTAWVQEEVIPVGECITNSSGQVTSYTAYPPLRRYDSQSVTCAASTAITHYHNLGINGALIQVATSIDNGVTWVPCAVTGATRLSVSFTTPASATLYRVQTRDTFS